MLWTCHFGTQTFPPRLYIVMNLRYFQGLILIYPKDFGVSWPIFSPLARRAVGLMASCCVRRPPCAVRRAPCAVRRSLCNSETPGPIYLRFGTNTHRPNTPRRIFPIFGTEPQKNILDQKLTKNAPFHILPPRTKTVQSNFLAFGTNNPSDPITLHSRARLAWIAISVSFWGSKLTWGLMGFSRKLQFLNFPSVTFVLIH